MKATLSLSAALRSAVAGLASELPPHLSIAAGVDPEGASPYFVELRAASAGVNRARQRIVFTNEQQVFEALQGFKKLLPGTEKGTARRGFPDLDKELAVLGTTASIAS
jgi:hypothetical protein